MTASATIHIDGAARGNPGPAACAFIIERDDAPPFEEAHCIGQTTNNVAEYTALVRALEKAGQLGAQRLTVLSDSELLVKQMNGEYRVKHPDLRILHDQAQKLRVQFKHAAIRHIPRAENSWADRLCNEALDGPRRSRTTPDHGANQAPARSHLRRQAAREEALTCLRAAATVWARGNAAEPAPDDVWDQLWSILEDHGVVRRRR
jgi:ribonuclease HI